MNTSNITSFLTEKDTSAIELERAKTLENKREEFYRNLQKVIDEDKDGEKYGKITLKEEKDLLDDQGKITPYFKEILRDLREEELINLEEKIANARIPTEDIFGLKRRFCNVCEQGCIGYEPHTILLPGAQKNQFPTFCKNCECPAYFHQMSENPKQIKFPQDLSDLIKNYNITSKDLNFNCVMVAFQIRNLSKETQNIGEFMMLMKEEGFEILSIDKRHLEYEEAIYLKSRMVSQTENIMLKEDEVKKPTKIAQIKKEGEIGSSTMNVQAKRDIYLMDKYANQKEEKLQKVQQTIMGQKSVTVTHIDGVLLENKPPRTQTVEQQRRNQTSQVMEQSINQRVSFFNNKDPSIARTSELSEKDEFLVSQQLLRTTTILPASNDKKFKVKNYAKNKTQKKSALLTTIPEEDQHMYITQSFDQNALLRELVSKELLILALGSNTFQNLDQKLKSQTMSKIKVLCPPHEMPLLYLSENKVMALEDSITFFPQLFRLSKSIIISEPLNDFNPDGDEIFSQSFMTDQNLIAQNELNAERSGIELYNEVLEAMNKSEIDSKDDHYFNNRKTLTKKLNKSARMTLKSKHQITHAHTQDYNRKSETEMNWAEKIGHKEKLMKKKKKLVLQKNKVLYNFGVMQDFFNYSSMTIQEAVKEIDASKFNGGRGAIDKDLAQNLSYKGASNAFAIAKVGLPNIIFPNSLDVKFSNYQNYASYLHIADQYFPGLSNSQHTCILLRPILVKNGLNDMFVQILKANDFVILKRKIRILRKAEIAYMAKVEGITEANAELYFNLMADGESEVVVATKFGGVTDGLSLVNGPNPYGRRRVAQLKEDTSSIRTNVDSINSMFEITPFSSFNEFLDLEDFMISHSRLEKYRKLKEKQKTANKLDEQLYYYKVEHIKREINIFSRFFNVLSYAAESEFEAHKQMCVLMPETAKIEESILLLNPLYLRYLDSAEKLLKRMGFRILTKKVTHLSEDKAQELFKEKLALKTIDHDLIQLLLSGAIHLYHLVKISGEREIRQTYHDSHIDYEDVFEMQIRNPPFKPLHLPYIFLHMDSPYLFESALKMLWPEGVTAFTGKDFIDKLRNQDKVTILDNILQTTLGDKIKLVYFDRDGKILLEEQKKVDQHESLQGVGKRKEPSYQVLYSNPRDHAVHYVVESSGHGLFEIRIQRLNHKNDSYNYAIDPNQVDVLALKQRLFTKFQALNFYYNEVNKRYYNVCPAFYRFSINPLTSKGECSDVLNRVYEVEEYMGKSFIEEIAKLHQDHLILIQNTSQYLGWQYLSKEQQKSLPPYIWGHRLARLCKQLEDIRGNDPDYLTGAGRIRIDEGMMKGEVPKSSQYFQFDKNRYLKYLSEFKKGWHYYLSVLETEIIEQKLLHILNSFTFKYSRLPQFLSLIPDRLTENNLRISEKIKVMTEKGLSDVQEKFFTHLKEQLIDPHREQIAHNQVQSIMHTLKMGSTRQKLDQSLKSQGTSVEEVLNQNTEQKFSIHQDCSIVGVEVARRPKYQLLAEIMYLVNFYLRKIDRKSEMFKDVSSTSFTQQDVENDYDEVLDIIFNSLTDNYGEDEYNYALDIVELKRGHETEFEKMMREKTELEQKYQQKIQKEWYEEERKQRTMMSEKELIDKLCYLPMRDYELKQRKLLKKFVEERGHVDVQGDGFQEVLRQTQAFLGPYSLKIAQEYIEKSKKKNVTVQEKISFVKMEYFLYGIREAYSITQQLKHLENRMDQMQDKLAIMKQNYTSFAASASFSHSQSTFKRQATTGVDEKRQEVEKMEEMIQRVRYTLSMKETEFVMVLRELIGWDFTVPDHYFDMQLMMSKQDREEAKEKFLKPMKTFWLEVEGIEDQPFENDLYNEKFHTRFRDYQLEAPQYYLPASLCRQQYLPFEHAWKERQGVVMGNLRPHDALNPTDQLTFHKFISKGEQNQIGEIEKLKTIIDFKTSKVDYQPQNPF